MAKESGAPTVAFLSGRRPTTAGDVAMTLVRVCLSIGAFAGHIEPYFSKLLS